MVFAPKDDARATPPRDSEVADLTPSQNHARFSLGNAIMLKYYAWAAAEKALSFVPGGDLVYNIVALAANAGNKSERRLQGCASSYRLIRKAREMTPPNGTIVDVGTGWHHHDAFLLHLCDPSYTIHLFDVVDKSRLGYIRVYLRYLLDHLDEVARELQPFDAEQARTKLRYLFDQPSVTDIYRVCRFQKHITRKTDEPFLPLHSVDCMISNCVLTHIPPQIALPELKALRQMLKPSGVMYHLVGHEDHWAFHDSNANQFNYYRYSDRFYHALFDTAFEYQNRMTKSEWLPVFQRAGLQVAEYWADITPESQAQIRALPTIDERFARLPFEELATVHSFFLLTL
jgi:SAM-dependent methyltransferase